MICDNCKKYIIIGKNNTTTKLVVSHIPSDLIYMDITIYCQHCNTRHEKVISLKELIIPILKKKYD